MTKDPAVVRKDNSPNFHVLAKPVGAACNLSCSYCYFLSKERLYPDQSYLMDEEILELYIRQLLTTTPGPKVQIAWQGGEPMLRGIEFYKRTVQLTRKYRTPQQHVSHVIQTNGTLINDEWAGFFKKNNYLVGLSLDGPKAMHDTYRVDKKGAGTFTDVTRAWECLQRHDVDVNILCTVHTENADRGLDVYHFFRDELGAQYIQFIPVVERATAASIEMANRGWDGRRGSDRPLYRQEGAFVTDRSVEAEQFGAFLTEIFDEWVCRDIGNVFVTMFDVALGSWMGQYNLCTLSPTCGRALAVEHNGDVYSCDHYVEPGHLLGNIRTSHLAALVSSEKQRQFGMEKYETLPTYCRTCPVLFACYGECPRNRFTRTPDGEPGLNYLCAGYKAFFTHITEPMTIMAWLIEHERSPAQIMTMPESVKALVLSLIRRQRKLF